MRLAAGILALALALALAVVSVLSYASWKRHRVELVDLLERLGTGEREPDVISDVRREPDLLRARLLVARALLADELDRRWLDQLPIGEREAAERLSLPKLDMALSLARDVLERQPASWQARMIVAGSTYLSMSRRGDPDRWRERSRWEQPLRDAMAMATNQAEPRRILTAAYLNDWSLMSEDERGAALEVMKLAFDDRTTFEQLLPAWLRRAASLDQAFALVPGRPSSWTQVENHYRSLLDWERVCAARENKLAILVEYTRGLLADAGLRRAGGDTKGARALALLALANTPVGPAHRETLDSILDVLPPGPIPPLSQQNTREWLAWAARQCLLDRCPLSRASLKRLGTLSQFETTADRAWAAELVGALYASDSYERDALVPGATEWAPFLLLRANRLTAEGSPEAAAALLAMIHPEWSERAAARSVRARVRSGLGDSRHRQVAEWQGSATLTDGAISFREFSWTEPPQKIRLRFGGVSATGAAVEIFWSNRWVTCQSVDPGAVVSLEAPAVAGYHVLEVRPVAGTQAGPEQIDVIR